MINITLPDNSVRQYPAGTTAMQVAQSISEGLARNVLSAKVNDEIWDLNRVITADSSVKLFTWDNSGRYTQLGIFWAENTAWNMQILPA